MAGKQLTGDGLPLNFAGMSKNQLYEIMSQMKSLIEQNQDQAKEILIQNPLLTKALFQAQIMLGMVQPPQMIPKVEPLASQPPQLSVQPRQQPSSQPPQFSSQASFQDQTRKQPQNQQNMSLPIASTTIPAISTQPPSVASHSLQLPQPQMLHQNLSSTLPAIPQSSQLPNIPPVSLHSSTKVPPLQQPQMPPVSGQLQQPNPSSGGVPLQPPLQPPLQLRPPSMQQPYHHQYPPQIGPGGGFSHSGGPQHGSQPMYHTAPRPAPSTGSFPQGQPPPPTQQQLPQSMYQVGGASHSGSAEFSHHPGGPVPGDRGSSWIPGLSEPTHLPGPPPVATPSQAGPTSHPSQPPSLSPEMEKALLQQVISLTQEQINLLPPEQRSQVLQLQQMLRQ